MSSSSRIKLPIDLGTWDHVDEDMVSLDPTKFYLEDEYQDRIDFYPEAIQSSPKHT